MSDARKRRRASWDEIFGSFDDEFDDMRRRMDDLLELYSSGRLESGQQPLVYGFSMRVGPDGRPRIQEFGNQPQAEPGFREPLTDIIEEGDRVRVIVELPGVDREDISLDAEDGVLDIQVDKEGRKFHKRVELPAAVDSDSAKASYKNGVLDVTLAKAKKRRGKPVRIDNE